MRATRVYIHTYDVAAHCATVARRHRYSVRTYVRMRIIMRFTCLACVGLAMRATRAYIRSNDVAAHCATVARRHRYSSAMSPHKTAI